MIKDFSVKYFFEKRFSEFCTISVTSVFIPFIIFYTTDSLVSSNPLFERPWDHHQYIFMASNNVFDYNIAPYCYRILFPLIVSYLPFKLNVNFFLVNFISISLTSIFLYYLLKAYGFEKLDAYYGLLLFFTISWVTKFLIWDFWLVDSMLFLFVIICLLMIVKKNDIFFMFFLFLGTLTKESALFIIPVYYSYHAKKLLDYNVAGKLFLLSIPAITIFLLIRIVIPPLNSDSVYMSQLPDILTGIKQYELLKTFSLQVLSTFTLENFYHLTVGAFGVPVLILSFIGGKKNLSVFKRFYPLIVLGYIQLFFAVDIQRLIVISFPVLIIMSIRGITVLREKSVKESVFVFFICSNIIISLIWDDLFFILKVQTVLNICLLILCLSLFLVRSRLIIKK